MQKSKEVKAVEVYDNEQGIILIIFSVVLVVMLGVLGIAIDSGNLYRSQLRLQRAADAGVLAGLAHTILEKNNLPTEPSLFKQKIQERAVEVTAENLAQSGIVVDVANDISAVYSIVGGIPQLSVSIDADIPLMIMDAVPLQIIGMTTFPSSQKVAAAAAGSRDIANISLILDVSDSMNCPSSGPCTCLTPSRTDDCPTEASNLGTTQRMQELTTAVTAFLDEFDEVTDRISVTGFNTAASLIVPFKRDGGGNLDMGFDKAAINTQVGNLNPAGLTNHCDAIMTAFKEVQAVDLHQDGEVAYLFFTDGAPTAGRFLLSDTNPGMDIHDPDSFGDHDYMSYGIAWYDDVAATTTFGPSPLVKQGSIAFGATALEPPAGSVPACDAQGTALQSNVGQHPAEFTQCITTFEAHMPGDSTVTFGGDYGAMTPNEFLRFREQYYNCAIVLSDHLRQNRGTVYVVGLGEADTDVSDIYQNTDDAHARKDFLLTRVANDYTEAYRIPTKNAVSPLPDGTFQGYTDYSNLQQLTDPREGDYLATPTAEQLTALFKKAAVKIQLKLIQ